MSQDPEALEIETPHGPARALLRAVRDPVGTLILGHGASGGVAAPDLQAAARAAEGGGFAVVLVEQPYRVAGRKAPAPAHQLDLCWLSVIAALRDRGSLAAALICGGRSLGARVACRTAAEAGAAAVLCLAFPVHPPGKANDPSKSRMPELDAVRVPTLVIQGESDPFGMPEPGPNREVVALAGNHGLKADLPALAGVIERWLPSVA